MPATVYTLTRPTGVRDYSVGDRRVAIRTLTADTGTYTTAGQTFTAAQVGMKTIYFVNVDGGVVTTGTAGVTASPLGITYAANGQSVTIQLYEGSAAGTALTEKTSAEALEANFTVRLRFEGR